MSTLVTERTTLGELRELRASHGVESLCARATKRARAVMIRHVTGSCVVASASTEAEAIEAAFAEVRRRVAEGA